MSYSELDLPDEILIDYVDQKHMKGISGRW